MPNTKRQMLCAIAVAMALTLATLSPAAASDLDYAPSGAHDQQIFDEFASDDHAGEESSPGTPDTGLPMLTEEELAELQIYNQEAYPEYYERGDLDPGAAKLFWPGELMWFVGKTALQFGLQKGFGAAMDHIMPGRPDPTAEALEQIADQLDGLRDQIQGVSGQVSELGEQINELKEMHEWSVYFDRERDVETHMANVHLYANFVAGYERLDQWDELKARNVVSVNAHAIAQIEMKLVNGTDPAFQNLQKILRYSPSETRWAQIDGYRRSYEAVLSTAVLSIMAAHERYPNLFQSELDTAVTIVERTVDALYGTAGLGYPQPMQFVKSGPAVSAGGQLHPFGANYIIASPNRPIRQSEAPKTLTTFEEIQSAYEVLLDDYYRGKGPEDTSFASHLRALGFSSAPIIEDSVRVFHNGAWRVGWDFVSIGVHSRQIVRGTGNGTYGTEAEAQAAATSKRAAARSQAPYRIDNVETNAGGHAVTTDLDALELGVDGAPIVWSPEDAGPAGQMGPLLLEHSGYDAVVFIDAVTGQRLGAFDVGKGPIETATIDAPPSGMLALILGESVKNAPAEDGYMVPVGSMLITPPESHEGFDLTFSPLRREFERLDIFIQDLGERMGAVYVNGSLACGRTKGTSCRLNLDPYAGPLQISANGGPGMILQEWGGDCSGGQWSNCSIDPGNGAHTITATFVHHLPR